MNRSISFPTRLRHTGLFILMLMIVISPWLFRNKCIYGSAGLSTQVVPHIVGYVIPYVMQYEEKINQREAREKSNEIWKEKEKTLPVLTRSNPFLLDSEVKKFGFKYLLNASPVSVAKAWFWGTMKNIFSPVTVELSFILAMDRTTFHESPGANVPEQLYNFIFKNKNKAYSLLMFIGIIGVFFFRSVQIAGAWKLFRSEPEIFYICCIVVGYFLLISGPVGYAKYRIPFEPILILFTAFGISCFADCIKNIPNPKIAA